MTFHDGRTMDAEDVATTFDRLADPDNGSERGSSASLWACSRRVDPEPSTTPRSSSRSTCPNGNFPYIASSDNYNSIILPKDYEGDWDRTFIGTGPWKLGEYRPGEGMTLLPNEQYWDPARKPLAEKAEVVFFGNEQSLILGFQGNQVDVVTQFSVSGGKALLTDPESSPPSSSPPATASATCAATSNRSTTNASARPSPCAAASLIDDRRRKLSEGRVVMASIEEVRSGIALAYDKLQSLGALQQAVLAARKAQQSLTRVTEGSSQADVNEANGQLQQAVQNISEVQQLVRSAISTAEGISQRL